MQFRHFANKIGNPERPFLKEFFPRWVGSYGCPVLRYDLSESCIMAFYVFCIWDFLTVSFAEIFFSYDGVFLQQAEKYY